MLRVLIAGGGVAALEAMLALRALAEERVGIELLAPEPHFWYRPLAVAEPFESGRVEHFELSALAGASGAIFTLGALAEVDEGSRVARTTNGSEIPYDILLLACGAVPKEALRGVFTFRGPADVDAFRRILDEASAAEAMDLVFAVAGGKTTWALPLYELALQTGAHFARLKKNVALTLVTHESGPLEIFGAAASQAIGRLLDERRIGFLGRVYAASVERGALKLVPNGSLRADRVVALPELVGQVIPGVPQDALGFVPIDRYGRVRGMENVFAAGDATWFPIKQGGLAAQQAVVAAETIAALAGASVTPRPFTPVLRGLVLTGGAPAYVRADLSGGRGETSTFASEPLWWPAGKIVGRYLAPFLASFKGVDAPIEPPLGPGVFPVEIDLSVETLGEHAPDERPS